MSEFGNMAIAGQDIPAETGVMIAQDPPDCAGKAFSILNVGIAGIFVGDTVENIREGFRISVKDAEVREDDA